MSVKYCLSVQGSRTSAYRSQKDTKQEVRERKQMDTVDGVEDKQPGLVCVWMCGVTSLQPADGETSSD